MMKTWYLRMCFFLRGHWFLGSITSSMSMTVTKNSGHKFERSTWTQGGGIYFLVASWISPSSKPISSFVWKARKLDGMVLSLKDGIWDGMVGFLNGAVRVCAARVPGSARVSWISHKSLGSSSCWFGVGSWQLTYGWKGRGISQQNSSKVWYS